MEKINGYAREEAEELIQSIEEGKKRGKTLTSLFAEYGKAHGRAGGSVRNYYYRLLKTQDEAAQGILAGKHLHAEQIRPFTEGEREEMLRQILQERGKGFSVRRSIANVCGGDEKKMLRYQNKYRNMIKKQPEQVRAAAEKWGVTIQQERRSAKHLEQRLQAEIDALYGRLAISLREENERLRETIRRLREENELLRRAGRLPQAMRAVERAKEG